MVYNADDTDSTVAVGLFKVKKCDILNGIVFYNTSLMMLHIPE